MIISRSVDDVFSLLGNPDNDPKWGSLIVESEQISPGPLGVGTRFRQTATFLGARMSADIEITDYAPRRLMQYRASQPIELRHRRTFEETPEGTRLTFSTEIDAEGRFRVAEGLLRRGAQRQMEEDMDEIKTFME